MLVLVINFSRHLCFTSDCFLLVICLAAAGWVARSLMSHIHTVRPVMWQLAVLSSASVQSDFVKTSSLLTWS